MMTYSGLGIRVEIPKGVGIWCVRLFFHVLVLAVALCTDAETASAHPWLPPFGLEQVESEENGPDLQVDARAQPEILINPVDLGTILVPHDWLLLAGGQEAVVDIAAFSRTRSIPGASLQAWFEGGTPVRVTVSLTLRRRLTHQLKVPLYAEGDRTVLHVSFLVGGKELWRKDIRTMVVTQRPQWPNFGAVETKLRYDASISVQDRRTKKYSTIDYDQGWDPQLNDVVVFLPNGSRFVFWRGSSYIPFWAGLYNTGLTYQWAETRPPPGYVDCVEPLQDKELRFGRVRIIESTLARVHVRWTYESVDVDYRRLGDQASEDFYFYPDGFGTRVLTLTSAPNADYELTEFITILPQDAYPFDVLPSRLIDILYLDGEKRAITFPYQPPLGARDLQGLTQAKDPRPGVQRLYRFFSEKRDRTTAIYFSPNDVPVIEQVFKPFYDQGQIVTPGYWGNHWPLGRGAPTNAAIDERIHLSPAHLSTFGWGLWSGGNRPIPLERGDAPTIDTLGKSRTMLTQRWAWLIGKTDASDEEVLKWANSYSQPPSLKLKGAHNTSPSYSAERRAMRIVAESSSIEIQIKPAIHTMNPVFEIEGAGRLVGVTLDGMGLPKDSYAWDGKTLWIRASIESVGANLSLRFE